MSNAMESYDNRRSVERYFEEAWNQGNIAAIDEIIAADFVGTMPPPNQPLRGPMGVKEFVTADRLAYPDLHFTLEETVAEANKVVARWTMRGTHLNQWKIFPPTGKSIEFCGVTIFTIKDSQIHRFFVISDALGLLQQLGVLVIRS
ncbi:MAG: ester cyclase [Nitrososphaerota archaeon]|nr:ester cyclase [Nitrososphaerota archaeon]